MNQMTPNEFINQVLIKEVGEILLTHPYISFLTMAVGIEFLGKCLNKINDWNRRGRSKQDFELAINNLNSFSKYRPLLLSHDFWTSFRNGFAHSFVPKNTLSLSSKDEMEHFTDITIPKINLRCEDLYGDFRKACLEVTNMNFLPNDKMNFPLLDVPTIPKDNTSYSGSTS